MNEHLRAHVPEIGILGIALAGGFEYLQVFVKLATLFMNRVASLTKPCRYSNPPASAIPKIPISGTCARRCSFMPGFLRKPILASAMDWCGSLGMLIGLCVASVYCWIACCLRTTAKWIA